MFTKLEPGARNRRVSTPKTVAISVAAHVAIVAAVTIAYAAEPEKPRDDTDYVGAIFNVPPPPPPPAPVRAEPQQPEPASVPGRTIEMPAPETVPTEIPEVDPTQTPITPDMVTGIGPIGNHIGEPTGGQPATPGYIPPNDGGYVSGIIPVEDLEDRPDITNRGEVERILSRSYPGVLRDAGIAGRTVVEMVILEDGTVDPESIIIVQNSHPSFAEPATRVARRMKFKPAAMMGQPVKVLISVPIQWTPQRSE